MEAAATFFGFRKKSNPSPSTTPPAVAEVARICEKPPQLPAHTSIPPITLDGSKDQSFSQRPLSPPVQLTPRTSRSLSPRTLSPSTSPRPTTAPNPSSPASFHRRLSTSSSQIFERNVQDPHPLTAPGSPAIPAHIQTEDYIPPVLTASMQAITDASLSADEVQIVTSAAHQPAVSVVLPSYPASPVSDRTPSPPEQVVGGGVEDMASYAGSSRERLSFVSFADVVQAEQQGLEAGLVSGGSSPASMSPVKERRIEEALRRSPSPLGSPTSESGGSAQTGGQGELNVETMRQALRRSASGDLGR